ncbi:hypothetical protein VTJ83DRAFT_3950 [Remersonia thermophila]|uniref:Ribosomal protein bL31m N-terminal domain-containing protein n=1 Tax=Remersonia thermophila TaxID=72144 RepID=A0ABR4DGD2_9PEZI
MGKLPSTLLRRPCLTGRLPTTSPGFTHTPLAPSIPSPAATSTTPLPTLRPTQVRHATFIPRHRRPYQFTQLVQLSDGSTFTVRTTSPQALYRSDKDSRNHILWNPSEASLRNVEVDEAGKLAAFRERYGTAWDLDGGAGGKAAAPAGGDKDAAAQKGDAKDAAAPAEEEQHDSLVDLISAFATVDNSVKGGISAKAQAKLDKSGKRR